MDLSQDADEMVKEVCCQTDPIVVFRGWGWCIVSVNLPLNNPGHAWLY